MKYLFSFFLGLLILSSANVTWAAGQPAGTVVQAMGWVRQPLQYPDEINAKDSALEYA